MLNFKFSLEKKLGLTDDEPGLLVVLKIDIFLTLLVLLKQK
jgi:hypothetical protein